MAGEMCRVCEGGGGLRLRRDASCATATTTTGIHSASKSWFRGNCRDRIKALCDGLLMRRSLDNRLVMTTWSRRSPNLTWSPLLRTYLASSRNGPGRVFDLCLSGWAIRVRERVGLELSSSRLDG